MDLTIVNNGVLQFDDAKIIHRNFSGKQTEFNREGDRNFSIVIPTEEMKDRLVADGWNVRIREPKQRGDEPFYYLPVKVKPSDRNFFCYIVSNGRMIELEPDQIGKIDGIQIESVSLDVRPYDWNVNGRTGRTAYLQAIKVVQRVNRFTVEYDSQRDAEDLPL